MVKRVVILLLVATLTGCAGNRDAGTAAADANQMATLPSGAALTAGANLPAAKPLATKTTLKVGIPSKLEVEIPALLADAEGEFAKENLSVTFVHDTVPNLLTLLGQDRIDLAYAGAQALVFNSLRRGVPIRWVSGVSAGSPDAGIYMANRYGPLASWNPATLKGKNIGVNPGGLAAPSEYSLYAALTTANLKPTDVTMTTFADPASMAQALVKGTIDGATLGPPYTATVKPDAFLAQGATSGLQIAGYFATTRLLGTNRDAGVAFFRALERTVNTHLTGNYHADAAVMAKIAQLLGTTTASLGASPAVVFDFGVPAASLPRLQDMYRSVPGTLQYEDTVEASELIDLSLVVDAAQGR
ncbi:hypothetical protein [Actinoplanes sp. NPDC051851]|uniref:ABC transporter substrate-binding protein n=1 Tax=Actinoplanes sp. NPDC051851 TaxID=3154753 RepID=UPI00342A9BF1